MDNTGSTDLAPDTVLVSAASYAPFGPVTGVRNGLQRRLTRGLDLNYAPTAIDSETPGGLGLRYTMDEVGNISRLASAASGRSAPRLDLEYDPLVLLPDLPAVLSAQLPGMTIQMGNLDFVGDRDQAYTAALENLSKLPRPRHARRRLDPRLPASWVEFLDADDSFGASRVLVLPDLLRRTLRQDFPASGVLVAVPTKFHLWIHLPTDESVLETSLLLAHEALTTYASNPFPLSPCVYLLSPDMQADVLVRPDRTGAFVNQEALGRLLAALGPNGPAEAA